ncbi:MAG TPA: prolipoprotein diacylglyceryl transferase family protein [Candidatus Limnocylindrales bacterium]
MSLAVLSIAFDPVVHLGDSASVRIETIALAATFLAGLLLAVRIGRRTPAVGPYVPAPGLRPDDLLFIVVGAVPGALLGGRLGYVLDHLDYYRANPGLMADFSQGALSLTFAVPLGILSGAIIARLIDAPVARWLHAAALPLLFVLAAGKLAGVLGATGQGLPSDLPWATSYAGPGPWGSLAPDVASHPAQAYEALLVTIAIGLLVVLARFDVIARRDGGAMFVAIALWAMARFVVAFTWRDALVLGPLRVDQLLSLLLVALALLGLLERSRAPVRSSEADREQEPAPSRNRGRRRPDRAA